ncbi:ABC transporter related [Catenulispora acidiphila DSM 44928]|uniref:ABC transporter related n=1 Tax=Catenulispora acidiphila (strain DSM 44928 / JCM 14897 / NBRC 102108 / NRRL B-24433 / ID139908) TaxID=479433 RepID=C7QCC7_CATAD|nr:ABC transporter ATP-binding protein [Catenulispora acidiphila]ACU74575.1 ABC transporter related [Catenulispora acidiphila DSM 44928]
MSTAVAELDDVEEGEGGELGTENAVAPGGGYQLPEALDGGYAVLRRGVRLAPAFTKGLGVTLALALIATVGRIVIPLTVQQTLDHGILAEGGPDYGEVRTMVALSAVAVLITAVSAYLMNFRLYTSSERGLAEVRTKAFRHVHDLSLLHQQAEQRGALVSRVTSDIDTVTVFIQQGGMQLFVAVAQVVVVTIVMAVFSWQLTILVWVCFVPMFLVMRKIQGRTGRAYRKVRRRYGRMLGEVSEALVGADVLRAYGIEDRAGARIGAAVEDTRDSQVRTQRLIVVTFSMGELVAGLVNAAIVVVGVMLGVGGHLSVGDLTAMLFLVNLFISPVQFATEQLNEAQNAIAGWRRIVGLLEQPPDVVDPGRAGVTPPDGPLGVGFEEVVFAYPGGTPVLHSLTTEITPRTRVAVVGETGSGKTTFAKLLTRLMDPSSGRILINGVPLKDIGFETLRSRMVMVPQDGFLFDMTVGDNVRYGKPGATDAEVRRAFEDLSLTDWLDGLPEGMATRVGQRGESLSAGERQLVALARAYIADPDLLVLDEATSAVDPATEVRITRALDGLTRGRTSIAIAHRLSTAEAADEVFVFDAGQIVERGPHRELVGAGGVYSGLYESWSRQQAS